MSTREPDGEKPVITTLECATPRGDKPAPAGKPEKTRKPSLADIARIVGGTAAAKAAMEADGAPAALIRTQTPEQAAKNARSTKAINQPKIKNPGKGSAKSAGLGMSPTALKTAGAKLKSETAKKPAAKAKTSAKPPAPKAATVAQAKPKKGTRVLRPDGLVLGSGMATLVDTVCRAKGATNEELCTAVGWKQCLPMMKAACEKANVALRSEKTDGKTRYFGTPAKK